VLDIERYGSLSGFADASPVTLTAILTDAAKFSEQVRAP
jgi:hypothetical protein